MLHKSEPEAEPHTTRPFLASAEKTRIQCHLIESCPGVKYHVKVLSARCSWEAARQYVSGGSLEAFFFQRLEAC